MDNIGVGHTFSEQVELILAYSKENAQNLPMLNANALQNIKMANKVMQADIIEIEMMIRQDPSLFAELLKIANSAIYRRGVEVVTVADAVVRLGRQELYSIVTTAATRSVFQASMKEIYDLFPKLWHHYQNHCVICAFGSGWLMSREKTLSYDIGFLAGMFHDIGKIIGLRVIGGLILEKKIDLSPSSPQLITLLEAAHLQLGSSAVLSWKLPEYIADTCLNHHQKELTIDTEYKKLIHCIRVISCLNTLKNDPTASVTVQEELDQSIRLLKYKNEDLKAIKDKLDFIQQRVITINTGSSTATPKKK